jgi:phosphate transport system permease protein
MAAEKSDKSFTGRLRHRKTKASVKVTDKLARGLITLGGLGTILAVATVCFYLVYVAVPLFFPSEVEQSNAYAVPWDQDAGEPIFTLVDEYQVIGYAMFADGGMQVFDMATGQRLGDRITPLGDRNPSAWNFSSDADDASFGFEDGTVVTARFGFTTEFIPDAEVTDDLREIPAGESRSVDEGIVTHTDAGQYRRRTFYAQVDQPLKLSDSPIRMVSHTPRQNSGPVIAALTADGTLTINSVSIVRNMLTGAQTPRVSRSDLPYEPDAQRGEPDFLLLSGLGDVVYLAWDDGHLHRFDLRDVRNPLLAEKVELLDSPTAKVTVIRFMIGKTTLIVGDDQGNVRTFFRIKPEGATTPDGQYLVATHDLGKGPAAVTAITSSARSRAMVAGFADGTVNLYHVTTNQLLASSRMPSGQSITAIAMAAKDDGILAVAGGQLQTWRVDKGHPSVNLAAISRPVWYEGFNQPEHIWQSSAGTDDFEPKYGLWPLVFGTMKATFYSMIFGLPIAIAAALYTSEFLHPRVKARVKPLVEMMASLPSVVLGFLAALVVAPLVEDIVPGTLLCLLTIPLAVLCGAYVWQILPHTLTLKLQTVGTHPSHGRIPRLIAGIGGVRFMAIITLVFVGAGLGLWLGPVAEWVLFAGDIKRWLDGQIGTGVGGWFIILLPVSAVIVGLIMSRLVNPTIRSYSSEWSRLTLALVDFGKFLAGCLAVIALAALLGGMLTIVGWDPRGSGLTNPLGTYVQRNAMVVGFIMGFAIIPIIYTIAEDALSAVPEHLRAASLGAGATPWQTGVRVIIPTAMSGLFSATMIGLGRAVGETMIVLMAAGNTAVTQMNIFNGFRTLSANIAVELPEAPMGGTHYRVLFLAALTLFIMTFIVNTIAEVIRIRFRKRAFQL